jgi:hypothetical protein
MLLTYHLSNFVHRMQFSFYEKKSDEVRKEHFCLFYPNLE